MISVLQKEELIPLYLVQFPLFGWSSKVPVKIGSSLARWVVNNGKCLKTCRDILLHSLIDYVRHELTDNRCCEHHTRGKRCACRCQQATDNWWFLFCLMINLFGGFGLFWYETTRYQRWNPFYFWKTIFTVGFLQSCTPSPANQLILVFLRWQVSE